MLWRLLRPLLFLLDPERAHRLVARLLLWLSALPGLCRLLRRLTAPRAPALAQRLFGLEFPLPVGLAAGFDKGQGIAQGLMALGFGFVECGTVTPRPQPGNERPRLFRLPAARALVNRMGFNNPGAPHLAARLARQAWRPGPVGANVGKNKDTPLDAAAADYAQAASALAPVADYLVVNVSSPNTPGLRDLQAPARLLEILRAVKAAAGPRPVLVKLSPDMAPEDLDLAIDAAQAGGAAGLVAVNTTLARPVPCAEAGGLSGAPLFPMALEAVRRAWRRTGGKLPIVGAGGVMDAESAFRLIRAGASLVQVYTCFVYQGPLAARTLHRDLLRILRREGLRSLSDAVGLDHRPVEDKRGFV